MFDVRTQGESNHIHNVASNITIELPDFKDKVRVNGTRYLNKFKWIGIRLKTTKGITKEVHDIRLVGCERPSHFELGCRVGHIKQVKVLHIVLNDNLIIVGGFRFLRSS